MEGYEVKVYAFSRGNQLLNTDLSFDYEQIGSFPNSTPYINRIPLLRKAIGSVVRREGKEPIYYVFGSYLGMFISLCWPGLGMIYEEGDLAHTYIRNGLIRWILERLVNDHFSVRSFKI